MPKNSGTGGGIIQKKLTPEQIAQVLVLAGFSAFLSPTPSGSDTLQTMVAVALAESDGNIGSIGGPNSDGTFDYGLCQINSIHSSLLASGNWNNPLDNAKMAHSLFVDSANAGHSGFYPWSAYNNQAYRAHMGQAALGVAAYKRHAAADTGGSGVPSWLSGLGGSVKNDFLSVQNMNPTPGISVPNPLSGIAAIGAALTNPHNYLRIAAFIGGTLLVVIALAVIIKGEAIGSITNQFSKSLGNGLKKAVPAK